MKLYRMASAVAATALVSSVALAAPAVADAKQASTSARTVAAPAAPTTPVMSFQGFPEVFTPGGDWKEFSLTAENHSSRTMTDFWAYFYFGDTGYGKGTFEKGGVELEYRAGGSWHPVALEFDRKGFFADLCPTATPVGNMMADCPAPIDQVAPGGTYTLPFRMRVAATVPPAERLSLSAEASIGTSDHVGFAAQTNTYWFAIRPSGSASKA
ncbi:hypothetical protein LE181_12555 [Streptomyces sp. SCA3-4]|uniref:hypothetical protein n=1 Tax=Streptomyces sichuanensis TaxID=2871810 RepID=UPI001CE3954D|nr:hypothetical protein [Streptomyces sichuanensis]MCA6092988.1 hypothetical protein [Streptomyces sichuanensis]